MGRLLISLLFTLHFALFVGGQDFQVFGLHQSVFFIHGFVVDILVIVRIGFMVNELLVRMRLMVWSMVMVYRFVWFGVLFWLLSSNKTNKTLHTLNLLFDLFGFKLVAEQKSGNGQE